MSFYQKAFSARFEFSPSTLKFFSQNFSIENFATFASLHLPTPLILPERFFNPVLIKLFNDSHKMRMKEFLICQRDTPFSFSSTTFPTYYCFEGEGVVFYLKTSSLLFFLNQGRKHDFIFSAALNAKEFRNDSLTFHRSNSYL